jgi:hypothetical protein
VFASNKQKYAGDQTGCPYLAWNSKASIRPDLGKLILNPALQNIILITEDEYDHVILFNTCDLHGLGT